MSIPKTTSPNIIVRISQIHNKGVFARRDMDEGTKVIEYVGEKVTKIEAERRAQVPLHRHSKDHSRHGAVYLFELNQRYDIDGDVPYNTARFINHSCDPNCEVHVIRGHIWIVSRRDIRKGEELTYNYGYSYENCHDHPCRCSTPRCPGFILAEDHWPKLQRKTRRNMSKRNVS